MSTTTRPPAEELRRAPSSVATAALGVTSAPRVLLRFLAFDLSGASAALLDGAGNIIDTNEAWQLFSDLNGGGSATGEGTSYVDVCARAAARGDEEASAVLAGLREVLAGTRTRFELDYRCSSPEEDRWFHMSVTAGSVANVGGAIVLHEDVTAHKMLQHVLAQTADRDALTGLEGRSAAVRFLRASIEEDARPVAAISVSIQGLDEINRRFGHSTGDDALVQASNRLRRLCPDDGMLCRVAGGQFLIVYPEVDPSDSEDLVVAIRAALDRPLQLGADQVRIGAAVGAASGAGSPTAELLLSEVTARRAADDRRGSWRPTIGSRSVEVMTDPSRPRWQEWSSSSGRSDLSRSVAAELHALQATTNAVLAHATDLVLFFAPDATIVWASPACERLFGIDPDVLTGSNGMDLIHPEDRDRVFSDFLTVPGLGDSVRTEFRVTDATGEVRWVEEVATNLLDEPDVGAVVGHLRDITDRKAAETAVSFQARLLAAAGQAIVARDTAGDVIYWNQAAEVLYGWTSDEAVGRRLVELVPPADGWAERSVAAAALFAAGEAWSGDMSVVAKSGATVPVRVTGTPVEGPEHERLATILVSADISEQLAGQATAARLAAIVDSSADAILSADADGRITTWNGSAAELFGYPVEVAVGMHLGDLLAAESSAAVDDAVRDVAAGSRVDTMAARARREDGTSFHASISLSRITLVGGGAAGISMIVRDVTESIEHRIQADQDRQRLADAQASAGLGSFEIDLRTGDVRRSDELWHILGRTPQSTGIDLLSCVHHDDQAVVRAAFKDSIEGRPVEPVTHRIVRPDGEVRWVLSKVSRSRSAPDRLFGTSIDITERHLAKLALAHQATHDPLTGLANRRLFVERLESALERDVRAGLRTAVLFIDLDDFKAVNDRIGHAGGDEILQAVGERIGGVLGPGDTIARLGGDEFVVCCEGTDGNGEVSQRVSRIQDALHAPFQAHAETFTVTCSIGVALSGPSSLADALLRDADAAMYAAKQQGPGRVEMFDQAMGEEAAHRRALIAELERAISSGQIHTYFQPEVELRTGQLIGFEALARWIHPERGVVSPAEFIPLAESSGLIHALGRRVLGDACAAMAAWITRYPEQKVTVSVNVSPVQMAHPQLHEDVETAIAAAGVPPGRICLEVTETALMDPGHAAEVLRNLKEIGVLIAVDDFGTGYSSLSRLKEFPVDFLKIDRTFVDGLGRDPEDELIVAAVADLAHSMGIQVIAEGIETRPQLEMLAAMGCEFGQGFLWSRARAFDAAGALFAGDGPFEHAPPVDGSEPGEGEGTWGHRANVVSDTVAFLVHELATPLTVAGGYATLLRGSPGADGDPELAAGLDAIARAVQDMGTITASLADARSMAEGTIVLDRRDLDVVDLLTELVDGLGLPVDGPGQTLQGSPSAQVSGDPARLRQVFRNLLANAVKWSSSSVRIHVDDDPERRFVTISVIDDGPGVPAERLGDLFRRFARLDPSRPGTGLGLYVSRTLARAHGGELRYHRIPEGGSEFAVELPRVAASSTSGTG